MALIKRSRASAPAVEETTDSATPGAGSTRAGAAPTPVAKKRVGGIAVGVSLAVLGGLTAFMASQSNEATPYLVANQSIERGQQLESSMLTTVDAAGDPATLIPAEEAQAIIGQVATTDLEPGSTITRTSVAEHVGVGQGEALVGLALDTGHLPSRDLAAGDQVLVVYTPGNENLQQEGSETPDAVAAVVEASGQDEASGKFTVDVRVEESDATDVAGWAAAGNASVIMRGADQ